MKALLSFFVLLISLSVSAQKEGDTLYSRCPVSVLDTATGNNYFIVHQPATIKTYKAHGDYVVVIEQKNQFFTMFFHSRFKTKKKYQISLDDDGRKEMSAKYSFKSGDDVAYIDVSNGTAVTTYDKTTKLWHVTLEGLIANLGDTRVTYFKAKADFYIK